jgi:hypothetical protein
MSLTRDVEAEFSAWLARRKATQLERRRKRAVRMLRVRVKDHLPMAGVWMRGPKWQRAFNVQCRRIAEVEPAEAVHYRPSQTFWWYDFEADVRERVLDEIRPGVVAEWSDPRERLPDVPQRPRAPPSPGGR